VTIQRLSLNDHHCDAARGKRGCFPKAVLSQTQSANAEAQRKYQMRAPVAAIVAELFPATKMLTCLTARLLLVSAEAAVIDGRFPGSVIRW